MHGGPRTIIVTVGEELLSGATLDGNAAWLGRRLGAVGIPVVRHYTVGDRDDAIVQIVREAVEQAPLVIVTGGLGPTEDDRTRPAVARALGLELVDDPEIEAGLVERTRAAGRGELPDGLRRLCRRPPGARVLPNPVGAAPGLVIGPTNRESGEGWVVLLPGVPREMKAVFSAVDDFVARRYSGVLQPVTSRLIHTTGLPESILAPRVEQALAGVRTGIEIAYLPDLLGVDLRLTASGRDASRRLALAEAALAPALDGLRFEAESGDLVEAVATCLEARSWGLATAESCTGGLVAQRWTARAGASRTFRGGVIAYADEIKERQLGVPPELLAEHGAVSEAVACRMAEGVCAALDAECGVAITGIAGPGGGTAEKPVGTVWLAFSLPGIGGGRATDAVREIYTGDREAVRVRAAQAALHGLLRRVERREIV